MNHSEVSFERIHTYPCNPSESFPFMQIWFRRRFWWAVRRTKEHIQSNINVMYSVMKGNNSGTHFAKRGPVLNSQTSSNAKRYSITSIPLLYYTEMSDFIFFRLINTGEQIAKYFIAIFEWFFCSSHVLITLSNQVHTSLFNIHFFPPNELLQPQVTECLLLDFIYYFLPNLILAMRVPKLIRDDISHAHAWPCTRTRLIEG